MKYIHTKLQTHEKKNNSKNEVYQKESVQDELKISLGEVTEEFLNDIITHYGDLIEVELMES